jgi:hypothetical protein
MIVDVVFVDSVNREMWAGGGKGVKAKGWGSCYQTGDQGGWDLVTTSKKLQVSRGYLMFAKGFNEKIACILSNIKYLFVM